MSSAKEYLQVKFLKTLEPLGSLSIDKLEELTNKSIVEELPPGRVIFRQGEKDSRTTYLLSGQVELQITGNPRAQTIKAKTTEARNPLAQEWPRPGTCKTKTNAVLLHIDSDLLEILLSDDPSGSYEVTEIGVEEDPESDWMLRFLQSPAFLNLPTDNIQKLLITLDEIPANAGDVIIKQGDNDEYYYIVKQGKCSVSRRPAPSAEEVRLAILGPGDGFGEEALITQGKRNATVTMKENGTLMRLGKHDFHELLVKPMLNYIDHATMMEKVKQGAMLIDVRTNREFNENGIKGASNIPLSMLRVKMKDLNITREHIVYCNDSHQSSAAAFLLGQQSLQACVLEGGLASQSKPFSTTSKTTAPEPTARSVTTTQAVAPSQVSPRPEEYQQHKKKAEQQAQRANKAEQERKSAIARTDNLKTEANQLRAQADRLAEKTARAEAERRKADDEINRLREKTLKERDAILANARQNEQEVNRIKQEAETARKRAEQELARIKNEAESVNEKQSQLEQEFKRAETEKRNAEKSAELARIIAKQEAEQVKAEAEAIRLHAQKEAERIQREMETRKNEMAEAEAAKQKAALEAARRKSEEAMREAARAAEEAKHQAMLEAEAIRKQALKEAEELRNQLEREKQQAAELVARNKAEQLLRQQQLEEDRQRALNEARMQATQEAEAIRQQALEEAQKQLQQNAQRNAELEAESMRKQSEDFQRKAMETARIEAEKAAAAIRQEALAEAQRLRDEMEAARKLVEDQTKLAQARLQDETNFLDDEDEALAQAAEEAARRAAEATERRRREQETLRKQEAEARARQQAEEARKRAEQESALRKAAEARLREEERRSAEDRVAKAKKMAESIKHRMEEKNSHQAQNDEFVISAGNGPKLAKAKVHVVKGKTILEGEEDIFIFKAPSETPPSREEAEKLLKEVENQCKEKSQKQLPSFDLDYKDEEVNKPQVAPADTDSEFSDSVILELDNISANTARTSSKKSNQSDDDDFSFEMPTDVSHARSAVANSKKKPFIMLAASIVVMVTISIIAVTRPTYIDVNSVAGVSQEDSIEPQRGLAAMRTTITKGKDANLEDKVRNEAEKEYHQFLSSWRKQNGK